MSLHVTDPITITPAQLVATDVPEDDHPSWDVGVTYAVTDRAIKDHVVWESAQDGNIGSDPATSPDKWLRVGPTNRWRAFDVMSYTTQTVRDNGFYYELVPARPPDAVHLLGFTAVSSVRVKITAPDTTVLFDSGQVAVGRVVPASSWWQWFFGSRSSVRQRSFVNLPRMGGATLRIEVAGGPGCGVGVIVVGNRQALAEPRYGVRIGIDDYSRIERNAWGDATLEKRAFAKRITATLSLDNTKLDRVERFLSNRRATPLFWSLSDKWQATEMLGFYRSWAMLIAYPNYTDVSLEIEGMSER